MLTARTVLSSAALLALVACATPTTNQPHYSDAELKAEQAAQAAAATKAPIYFNDKKNYGYKQIEALDQRLGPIAERIQRAAGALCDELPQPPDSNCIFTISMNSHEHALNAHTDGKAVVINPAMVDFIQNDNQLAFVLAHEMGHNVMRHIDKQEHNANYGLAAGMLADIAAGASGVNSKGSFTRLGGNQALLRYSPQFEAEADYVGLYILARAGYKIEDAPDLWRIISQAQPDSIYVTRTHPNNPARTIAMEKTVREIRAKQQQGLPLVPNIVPQES